MKVAVCSLCGKRTSGGKQCKSCSNRDRKGRYKISEMAKKNISISLIGKSPWNKGKNSKTDKRIKIKNLEEVKFKKYGMKQQEWIDFSKNLRSKFNNCYECKKPIFRVNSDIDHKIPYSNSKDNSIENLVILCKSCHAKKTYHKDKVALWGINH